MSGIEGAVPGADVGQLPQLALSTETLEEFLQEVTVLAAGEAALGLSCGLTVRTSDKRPHTLGSSDGFARRLDEIQYSVGGGPCLQALSTGETIEITELATEGRWPEFVAQATGEGLLASMSVPVRGREDAVGALNLYMDHVGGFTETDRLRAVQFADQAAAVITLAARLAEHERLHDDLQTALTSRTVIDQALGIIMGQQGCTADEAFAVLRRHSQNRNIRVREVAARLVTQVSGQPPQPGPPVH